MKTLLNYHCGEILDGPSANECVPFICADSGSITVWILYWFRLDGWILSPIVRSLMVRTRPNIHLSDFHRHLIAIIYSCRPGQAISAAKNLSRWEKNCTKNSRLDAAFIAASKQVVEAVSMHRTKAFSLQLVFVEFHDPAWKLSHFYRHATRPKKNTTIKFVYTDTPNPTSGYFEIGARTVTA